MWGLAVVGAVVIGIVSPPGVVLTWLSIVLAAVIIGTFCIQIAIQRPEGFVYRVMSSIGGALVVLTIATLAFMVLG